MIRDVQSALTAGHRACCFVLKDSYLEEELKQVFGSRIQLFSFWGERSEWRKKILLRDEIIKQNIQLIHCYDFSALPTIIRSLKQRPLISLVLTVAQSFSHLQQGILFKRLIRRVDRVFVTTKMLESLTHRFLPLPIHKVVDIGIGLEYSCPLWTMTKETFLKKHGVFHKTFLVGVYIPSHFGLQDFSILVPLLRHSQLRFGKQVHFLFYSPLGWESRVQYKLFYDFLISQELESVCSFSVLKNFLQHYTYVDLWLAPFRNTVLLDFHIQAIALGIPVLWQRDTFSQQLLELYPTAGETYKYGDAREFAFLLERYLTSQLFLMNNYLQVLMSLFLRDNASNHMKLLTKHYSTLIKRRQKAWELKKGKL